MGLTPVEIFLHVVLGFSALLLVLMLSWNFARFSRRKLKQWQALYRRYPDEFLALQTDNSRLKAEHAMMATRLEQVMENARARIAEKEAETSRAINRAGMLAEDLANARKTIATHEHTIITLENMLQDVRQQLERTRERARELFAERSDLKLTLEERMRAYEETSAELKRRTAQLQELQQELDRLRRQYATRKQQMKALFAQRRDLQNQVASLRKELADYKQLTEQLERELTEERARFIREKLGLQERITRLTTLLTEKEAKLLAARTGAAHAPRKERASA